jgi:hypothetical protein
MSLYERLFGPRRAAKPLPYPPSSPEGLAARWVQWAARSPESTSPIADRTGEWAAANQPDDVWFLAGTFGGPAQRKCTIPAGVPLFFPVFNMWRWPALSTPVVKSASGSLWVNGERTEVDAIGTPQAFEVDGVARNPVTGSTGFRKVSVWGLWRRLDPLPPGEHMVQFDGTDGHRFFVGPVTYLITVEG